MMGKTASPEKWCLVNEDGAIETVTVPGASGNFMIWPICPTAEDASKLRLCLPNKEEFVTARLVSVEARL